MLVSVVIPSYNVEKYIEEAVHSVMEQSYQDIEVIVIDDHSSDSSFAKLLSLQQQYAGKLVVRQNPENRGASYTRNQGLSLARGEFVQFLDADDLLLPAKIAHQVKLLSSFSEPVLLVGNYQRLSTKGTVVKKTFDSSIDPWIGIINSALGCTCSNLWPRQQLLEIGGWKEGLKSSQEYDLMFRLLKTGIPVRYDSEFLTIVRDRESGSISQVNLGANWKRYIDLRIAIFEYLSSSGRLTVEIKNSVLQRIFEGVRVLYKFDKEAALSIYSKYIFKKYSPKPSIWITSNYLLLYRMFGFEAAEGIRRIFRKS